jgi:hypothetical protein
MKHKIKVITLPTEDKTDVSIDPTGHYHYKSIANDYNGYQHLYITVSHNIDAIKVGDFILAKARFQDGTVKTQEDFDNAKWEVEQVSESGLVYVERVLFGMNSEKGLCGIVKIIATTDPKLTVKEVKTFKDVSPATNIATFDTAIIYKPIPQVPQSFLKEFVANPDGEWEVEYEEKQQFESADDYNYGFGLELKLNKDSTVNITSVKEKVYSRAEVEELVYKFSEYADSCVDHDGIMSACCSIRSCEWDEEKWIKENL